MLTIKSFNNKKRITRKPIISNTAINKNSAIKSIINDARITINKDGTIYFNNEPMNICKNNRGYCYISYSGFHLEVHRIIAFKFIPNPKNLPCVNHKDENKLNNNVDNLEWCDYSYNSSYNNRAEYYKTLYGKKVKANDKIYNSIHEAAIANNITLGRLYYYLNKDKTKSVIVDGVTYKYAD